MKSGALSNSRYDLAKRHTSVTPYYSDDKSGIVIYHGDARAILPEIESVHVIVWDPVWPNFHPELKGSEDPEGLFVQIADILPDAHSLHVWLGVQSDPRFMVPLSKNWKFLRTSYLSRAVPGYNGRCLVTGDLLYSFGDWPKSVKGAHVIPGECRVTSIPGLRQDHPCARNERHCQWVLKWWAEPNDVILDPQCGSGTVLKAAKDQWHSAIGIEIEERYCEIAARRLSQDVLQLA